MGRALVVFVVATMATSGCAGRGDLSRLRTDVEQLTQNVSALRAQPASPPADVARNDIKSIDARTSALESRLIEIVRQLGQVEGRVGAVERAVEATAARVDAMIAGVAKLEASRTAPPPSPIAPPSSSARAPAPALEPPPARTTTPEQMYASALAMFRAREHGQAVLDFLDFLGRYPKHPLASAAQYWIGEAYFVQRDYRQAVVEFDKVLEHGPASARVPDALLRTGLAWKNLRDQARAAELWKRLVREYPKSEAARRAQEYLTSVPEGTPPLSSPPAR